jgi:hypothetical protein
MIPIMEKKLKDLSIMLACLLSGAAALCQPVITGPACVVPGIVYQYHISGNWDSVSTMQVCITGGVIADSAALTNCTAMDAPLAAVLVTWKDSVAGSIALTSSLGSSTLNVSVTSALRPGSIAPASEVQSVGYDSVPATIYCSVDTGGSCSPSYRYQWLQSTDQLKWTDVEGPGATAQDLSFTEPLTETRYYRRRVTETVSGVIGYSGIATVNVDPQMPSAYVPFKGQP